MEVKTIEGRLPFEQARQDLNKIAEFINNMEIRNSKKEANIDIHIFQLRLTGIKSLTKLLFKYSDQMKKEIEQMEDPMEDPIVLYHIQNGGTVKWDDEREWWIIVTPPQNMNLRQGDPMPYEWIVGHKVK
jgi:hypothetical protein